MLSGMRTFGIDGLREQLNEGIEGRFCSSSSFRVSRAIAAEPERAW